jgi:CheY-like chemotaxis protein
MTKILLVEDDKSLREIYGVRLLAEGYDIVSAGDGEEALAMAIKEKPTLIISDVMMPKISGFDMLDILRSTTETKNIKVIMMTALSSEDQRARGEQLGADRYLVKSQVGIEDVVRTVHEVLNDPGAGVGAGPSPKASEPAAGASPASTPAATPPAPATPPAEPPVAAPAETPAATPPAEPAATDTKPAEDTAATDTVASATSPGNDSAGPLPPQPSENQPLESALPQPTAPFSSESPRPANLGEEAIHEPETPPADTPAPASEVSSSLPPLPPAPADDSASDKDVDQLIQPPVGEPAASGGLGFDETPAADGAAVVGAPASSVEPASVPPAADEPPASTAG